MNMTNSKTRNCDGVVLEIYLDHKFQRPQFETWLEVEVSQPKTRNHE